MNRKYFKQQYEEFDLDPEKEVYTREEVHGLLNKVREQERAIGELKEIVKWHQGGEKGSSDQNRAG